MTEKINHKIVNSENEISLKELLLKMKEWFQYLKTKWRLILVTLLFGSVIGFTYAYFQKTKYTATLTFALEDEKNGSGGLSGALGLASSLGIDMGANAGGAFSGSNLIELMKSRTIIERALLNPLDLNKTHSISLAEYFIEFTKLREILSRKKELTNLHYLVHENRDSYSLQKDSLLGEIYKKIVAENSSGILTVIQKDKKISIISVEVKSQDEFFSKSLAESIVKEVSEFYIDSKSKKAKNNVAILQRQTDSIRNELNDAISGVAKATDNVFNLNSALNIKRAPSTRRQVDVQANTAILTQLVTNLEMAKVTLLKETPLIQIIDKPILPLKKEKIGLLMSTIIGGLIATLFVIFFILIKMSLIKFIN